MYPFILEENSQNRWKEQNELIMLKKIKFPITLSNSRSRFDELTKNAFTFLKHVFKPFSVTVNSGAA